jgi:hypothetical protein
MQETRGRNRLEFMSELIDSPRANETNVSKFSPPKEVYTLPKQQGMPETNRAFEITTKNDQEKDHYIGIQNIDEAVKWYFENRLRLSVIQNNNRICSQHRIYST